MIMNLGTPTIRESEPEQIQTGHVPAAAPSESEMKAGIFRENQSQEEQVTLFGPIGGREAGSTEKKRQAVERQIRKEDRNSTRPRFLGGATGLGAERKINLSRESHGDGESFGGLDGKSRRE